MSDQNNKLLSPLPGCYRIRDFSFIRKVLLRRFLFHFLRHKGNFLYIVQTTRCNGSQRILVAFKTVREYSKLRQTHSFRYLGTTFKALFTVFTPIYKQLLVIGNILTHLDGIGEQQFKHSEREIRLRPMIACQRGRSSGTDGDWKGFWVARQ